jgi:heme exporter protein D
LVIVVGAVAHFIWLGYGMEILTIIFMVPEMVVNG